MARKAFVLAFREVRAPGREKLRAPVAARSLAPAVPSLEILVAAGGIANSARKFKIRLTADRYGAEVRRGNT